MDNLTLPSDIKYYLDAGFYLVPIPAGQKGPLHKGWQIKGNCFAPGSDPSVHQGNWGLAHAYSGTMALDIDNWDLAYQWFQERGVDLLALYNTPGTVKIHSGKPNHYKFIFRMPDYLWGMRSFKIKENNHDILDFRCGTANGGTVQDVLPPSIHPDTGLPYQWEGDWQQMPEIPRNLLDVWCGGIRVCVRNASATTPSSASEAEVRAALAHISPDISRNDWVQIGMAIHSTGEDWALDVFDQWSQGAYQAKGAEKYAGLHDVEICWRSFKEGGGKTINTVFKAARLNGWNGRVPIAFDQVQPAGTTYSWEDAPAAISGELIPATPVNSALATRTVDDILADARQLHTIDTESSEKAKNLLLEALDLDAMDQERVIDALHASMRVSKGSMKQTLAALKKQHSRGPAAPQVMYKDYIYVAEQHCYMHREGQTVLRPEAIVTKFLDQDPNVRENLVAPGGVEKFDSLTFDPAEGDVIPRGSERLYNTWRGLQTVGTPGDIDYWWNLVTHLAPVESEREFFLDWMAFTLQYPGEKVNFAVVIGGGYGIGKDSVLHPLTTALGRAAHNIQAELLTSDFNGYLQDCKLLVVNEANLGSHRDSQKIEDKMKVMLATPPLHHHDQPEESEDFRDLQQS